MTQRKTDEPAAQAMSDLEFGTDGFGAIGADAIRLLCGERRRVDVAVIRRSLADAMLAWPGSSREQWWKWLVETGRELSYATRVIDASPQEIFELLRHGAAAVTHIQNDADRLLVLTGAKRQKFRLCELPGEVALRWVSQSALSTLLGRSQPTLVRRWVILDPMSDDLPVAAGVQSGEHAHHDTHGHAASPSPWSRLWEFLRPEWSDFWIVLVFALFTGMLRLATPIAVESLVNTVAFGTLLQPLVVLSIILLTFLAFAAALRYLQRFVVELIQRRLFARVAARLAWQLPRVRLDHTHEFSPELLNRFFDIVTVQKVVAQLALDGLSVFLTVSLGMIVLAFYHPWLLAFDALLLVPVVFNIFLLGRGAVSTSIAESKSKYAVAGWFEDMARCPATFKSAGGPELALTRADRLTTDYLLARQAHFGVLSRQIISALALEALASAALLGLGGFLVIQGQLTLGQLVAAELIVTLIVASIAKLDKQFEGFYDLLASVDKLGHLFDLPVEPSSGVMHVGRTGAARLAVRHVNFAHAGGFDVLTDTTLDVAPGQIVAITGPAGCGKSTLLDLIFRLREPSHGRIVLDNFDLSDLRSDVLRQHVALVRGIEVLEGTLAENVHLERPEVTAADVRNVLRQVGLDEAETVSHDGMSMQRLGHCWSLETKLAHDGRPLSESQARRLMLARALVVQPRLLLIDGLLDSFSDDDAGRLLDEFKKSRQARTVLIATGRQAIIECCDRTWEL
jgi:putative ABC transport system ATP-binding protein